MKNIFFFILSLVLFSNLIAQNTHSDNVLVQYDSKPIKFNNKHIMQITFDNEFNDTLEIFIDDKLIKKDFFLTDRSLGITSKYIAVTISNKLPSKILRVKNINTGEMFELALDWRYKRLLIFKVINDDGNKWYVGYTNGIVTAE